MKMLLIERYCNACQGKVTRPKVCATCRVEAKRREIQNEDNPTVRKDDTNGSRL